MYLGTDGARGYLPSWVIPIYIVDKFHGAYTVEEIEDAPPLLVSRMLTYLTAMSKARQLKQEQAEAKARATRR